MSERREHSKNLIRMTGLYLLRNPFMLWAYEILMRHRSAEGSTGPTREDRTRLDCIRMPRKTNEKISTGTPVADVQNQNAGVVKQLLAFVCPGNAERYTAIVVSLFRC